MVQKPRVETRPRSNFPASRIVFSTNNQLNTDETFLRLLQNFLVQQLNHATTNLSSASQHHAKITQSHTFAALIHDVTLHDVIGGHQAIYSKTEGASNFTAG